MAGKFLQLGDTKLYPRGATYGAFEPNADGVEYHDVAKVERDFELMAERGFTAVRIPHTMPPVSLLDAAERHGLHVMVGLGAEQYAGYLADGRGGPDVAQIVRERVREVADHPAILCIALGNEIPAAMTRWIGRRKVERYLERLYHAVKDESPDAIVTYVNYPSTEYLDLPFLDLVAFNVYLEDPDRFAAYLQRLQNIAGDRPLLMSELGLDSMRNGPNAQARSLVRQIRTAYTGGCAGTFVFSWTDEWHRAGEQVDDWAFGLTRIDRSPRPALDAVQHAYAEVPFPDDAEWPSMSVVVCTYNGARTLPECLSALRRVDYPDFEVIVVDDGSTDDSATIAEAFGARVIRTANNGLSSARNVGATAAVGEIVAYLDDDAAPDVHWLGYLADSFMHSDAVAVGGPNIPPADASFVEDCVAHSPGGPIHVLLDDYEAEHIPGCNLAIRRSALEQLGGFDPRFRAAGDDVDLCWRIHHNSWHIRFNPAAMVWHRRRATLRGYLRQQRGYGRAEALLERKWPDRFNAAGHVSWSGQVYGSAFARLTGLRRARVYGGTWGMAPFQSLYQASPGVVDALARMPEWYLVIASLGVLSVFALAWPPLAVAVPLFLLAISLPLFDAVHSALRTRFSTRHSGRRRAATAFMHLAQPIARLWGRVSDGLSPLTRRVPAGIAMPRPRKLSIWSERWRPPEELLLLIDKGARSSGLAVREGGDYDDWDVQVRGGVFGAARMRFCAEDHGAGKQYFRVALRPRPSRIGVLMGAALAATATLAATDGARLVGVALGSVSVALLAAVAVECGTAIAVLLRIVRSLDTEEPELATVLHWRTLELQQSDRRA